MQNILIIVQARSRNSRLPGKNFEKIGDKTILEHHLDGLPAAINKVIALPCKEPMIKKYIRIAKKYNNIAVEQADKTVSEDSVLIRFTNVVNKYNPDWIVRTTADCWNMDKKWVQSTIDAALEFNIPIFNSYKEGSTLEVFPTKDLYKAVVFYYLTSCGECLEHVTHCMKRGFEKGSIDTPEDLEKAREKWGKL